MDFEKLLHEIETEISMQRDMDRKYLADRLLYYADKVRAASASVKPVGVDGLKRYGLTGDEDPEFMIEEKVDGDYVLYADVLCLSAPAPAPAEPCAICLDTACVYYLSTFANACAMYKNIEDCNRNNPQSKPATSGGKE